MIVQNTKETKRSSPSFFSSRADNYYMVLCIKYVLWLWVTVRVFNATFNNISVISWW